MPTREPSSEIAAVLRREAEQLEGWLADDCEHDVDGHSPCFECTIQRIEAFARRQQQQALREAADEPTPPDLSAELREWTATALNVFLAPDGLVATPETIEHWAQIVDAHTHALIAARADAEGTGGGD